MAYKTKFSGIKHQFKTGATSDKREGKGRFDLISPYVMQVLADIMERGAKIHGGRNWEKGIPYSALLDSAKRHINKFEKRQEDEDHLGQAFWRLHALLHFRETGRLELDDRPIYASRTNRKL